MRVLLMTLMLVVAPAKGANIYVIDGGLEPAYIPQIQNRLLRESCYSVNGDSKRSLLTDSNNTFHSKFYQYRWASLCFNTSGEQHGNPGSNVSTLRTHNLPGAEGRNGFPDVSVEVNTDQHQTVVAGIIKDNTSVGVKQWHVHNESLLGLNNFGAIDYANYNTLNQGGRTVHTVQALKDLADGSLSLNGVRVISMSQFVPKSSSSDIDDRYTWPCDNHPDVRRLGILNDYARHISTLRQRGVIFVTATDNSVIYPSNNGDLIRDNDKIPFPACLSTTIAVGGLSNSGVAQGALGPGIDFLENYHARNPLTTGSVLGTSYATPKVASYLTELQTGSPFANSNQAVNHLRDSGSLHCGSRTYGNITKEYCIIQPNFNAARNRIVDPFWNEYISLSQSEQNNIEYGWNYGTSQHNNGALAYFDSSVTLQKSLLASKESGNEIEIQQESTTAEEAVRFSFRAYDINSSDELQILVNDKPYGFVQTTGSNQLGATQSVCIPNSDLMQNGARNEVKLRLKNSRLTWGVTDLRIQRGFSSGSCQGASNDNDNSITLVLGQNDTNQYGRNYGRNNNLDRLDVSFFAAANTSHTFSWQPFDTENGEMKLFLNDQELETVSPTSNNRLGALDQVSISAGNLLAGNNVLSFRITDGDQTWGVTNLLVDSLNVVDGQPSSEVLLEFLETRRFEISNAYDYTFNFVPRGVNYDETITLTFDTRQQNLANGFHVFVNGVRRYTIPRHDSSNSRDWIARRVVLDKSLFRTGNNTITIWTSSNIFAENAETLHRNVRIVSNAIPFHDIVVTDASVSNRTPFDVVASIDNVGIRNSSPNTISFYVSESGDKSNPTLLGSTSVGVLLAGSSNKVSYSTDLMGLYGKYIWACIGIEQYDRNTLNNCSKAVTISRAGYLPSIIMLLLDDSP